MSDEQLRLSDAEREQAATALGEHYAQGRITADEHAERLDQVWAARTRAELQPVFRDLPGPAARRTAPEPRFAGRGPRGFRPPLFALLAVLVVLTVVTHLPFLLVGFLVAVFVLARRRHRYAGYGRGAPWAR